MRSQQLPTARVRPCTKRPLASLTTAAAKWALRTPQFCLPQMLYCRISICYDSSIVVIGPKDDVSKVDCIKRETISVRSMGVQAGSVFSSYVQGNTSEGVQIKTYESMENGFPNRARGSTDYSLETVSPAAIFLSKNQISQSRASARARRPWIWSDVWRARE